MSIEPHLKRVLDPLMAYARWFYEVHIEPRLRLQCQMQIENMNKELLIIKQLDRERQHAQYTRDLRQGWLSAA